MNETTSLILRILLYTGFIIFMIFFSKKIMFHLQEKNINFKSDKRIKVLEKQYIFKDVCLLLIKYDEEEILCCVTGQAIEIISRKRIGEDRIENAGKC